MKDVFESLMAISSFDELLDKDESASIHHQNIQKLDAEKIQFLDPEIWELTPNDIKCLANLKDFKTATKKWKPTSYLCRICKICLHGVGFLQQVPFKRVFYTF